MSEQPEPTVSNETPAAEAVALEPMPIPIGRFVAGFAALLLVAGLAWFVYQALQDDGTLVPVTGRVLLNGEPLDNGYLMVHFAGSDAFAVAQIDNEGRYRLVTNGDEGARIGTHRVVIKGMTRSLPPQPTVHSRYGEASTTPLLMKVTRDGQNHFEFDVENP